MSQITLYGTSDKISVNITTQRQRSTRACHNMSKQNYSYRIRIVHNVGPLSQMIYLIMRRSTCCMILLYIDDKHPEHRSREHKIREYRLGA